MTNPIATAVLILTCAGFGSLNGWQWAWGAVCGVVGQWVLTYVLERMKDPEDERTRFDE